MQYIFDIGIATLYGVDLAIFLKNLAFWTMQNKANNLHYYDGRYWTYNTLEAFQELFPFWTVKQIRRIIKSGIDQELIVTGNYNEVKYDRTLWYSLTDIGLKLFDSPICPNGQINSPKRANQSDQKGTPIPDVNTDNKTTDKNSCSNEPFERFYSAYPRKQKKRDAIKAWAKVDPAEYDKIMIDLANRKTKDVQWKNKQFIPLPATYLNGECWNDEIITEQAKQPAPKPNEPRSTVPWFNPEHANINSQGVKADEHRGNQSRGRDLQQDQTNQTSRQTVVRGDEPGSSRTDGVKKASTFLLPNRLNR